MHHSYLGPGIDSEVMHRQARDRMSDRREDSRDDTVVHHHTAKTPCKSSEHTVYTHADQKVMDKVYVEDGAEMWGIADPKEKR